MFQVLKYGIVCCCLLFTFAVSAIEEGTELFDQVTQLFENHYYGFPKGDPLATLKKRKTTL